MVNVCFLQHNHFCLSPTDDIRLSLPTPFETRSKLEQSGSDDAKVVVFKVFLYRKSVPSPRFSKTTFYLLLINTSTQFSSSLIETFTSLLMSKTTISIELRMWKFSYRIPSQSASSIIIPCFSQTTLCLQGIQCANSPILTIAIDGAALSKYDKT